MKKHKNILAEFARHLKQALSPPIDKVAVHQLIEAFRDTLDQLSDEQKFALYTQNPEEWEEVLGYFITHGEITESLKKILFTLLEKTSTPPPSS